MSLDLTLVVFDHVGGAERAYADVMGASAASPWVHEIAFVEHHRHDRIVVRGTFAGRYVDVDDEADVVIGKRTAEGALTGAIAGVLFGPAGLAVGLVGGATAGSVGDGREAHLHDALIDDVRAEVPEKSSAILLLASPEHTDAMIAAFEGHRGRLIRHRLSPQGAQVLESAVVGRPRA
jgi:uncharacterized membrane protein